MMKSKPKYQLRPFALAASMTSAFILNAPAATVTWDGGAGDGLWNSATNWSGDALPASNDTIIINNGDTVIFENEGNLPNNSNITLSGNSALRDSSVIRLNSATITIESGSSLTGDGFWDLNNATLNFKDGATANMESWEQKGINTFNFELSAGGFTALTPKRFFIGDGVILGDIANATYTVDMAAYTSGTGTIVLVDFNTDFSNMDNTTFQKAGGLNITNAAAYSGSYLQWNDTTEAIELVVVPELSGYTLIAGFLALLTVMLRRR